MYKELSELNSKKASNPTRKWARDAERWFTEEEVQVACGHMRPCPASLATREMQIRPSRRHHYTPAGVAEVKK